MKSKLLSLAMCALLLLPTGCGGQAGTAHEVQASTTASMESIEPKDPNGTLRVWAFEEHYIVREALLALGRQYPNLTVETEYLKDKFAGTGLTADDMLRTMNTALLAGDMPDVLILDEMPIDSYIRKELFADLSGVVDTADYYENIIGCYTVDDYAYAYPALFAPAILVRRGVNTGPSLAGYETIRDMLPILCVEDNFHFGGYQNVFTELFDAMAPAMFPGRSAVDEAALHEFLDITKTIVDAQALNQTELDPVFLGGGQVPVGSDYLEGYIPVSLSWYGRYASRSAEYACGLMRDYSLTCSGLNFSYLEDFRAEVRLLPGEVFVPTCILSVPVGAQNPGMAKELIRLVFEGQTVESTLGRQLGVFVKKGLETEARYHYYLKALADDDPDPLPYYDPREYGFEDVFSGLTTLA